MAVFAAEAGPTEADYQRELCAGMELEVELPNGGRVDCVCETHPIEVDFSEKWAEALCLQYALRLEEAIAYWQLPVTV